MNEEVIKEHPGVAKVKQMWDKGDFETIDRMVRFWEALENLGLIGDLLRRFIIWFGVVSMGYFAFSGWLVEFIKGASK